MMERLLSEKAKKIFYVLAIIGLITLGYLVHIESPLVDWLDDLRRMIFSSERRAFKHTVMVGVIPVCLIAFVPAFLYDLVTGQGKFER